MEPKWEDEAASVNWDELRAAVVSCGIASRALVYHFPHLAHVTPAEVALSGPRQRIPRTSAEKKSNKQKRSRAKKSRKNNRSR